MKNEVTPVIYSWTLISDGRMYIGQSMQYSRRRKNHITTNGSCPKFHNAIKKYGINAFKEEILFSGDATQDDLNILEQYYIWQFNTVKNGFNIALGGVCNIPYVYDPERIEHHRQALKHHFRDSENIKKRSDLSKRMWENEEYSSKMCEIAKARRDDPIWMERNKKQREDPRNAEALLAGLRKKYSDPLYQKEVRERNLNITNSPEWRAKMKELSNDPEWREKNRNAVRKSRGRPVQCVETGEIFDVIADASREYHISNGSISQSCRNPKWKGGGYHWVYIPAPYREDWRDEGGDL